MYKLLVVDDEPLIADGIYELISQNFNSRIDVRKCYSGVEALDLFGADDFDVAILDIKMPVISGIQLKDLIREKNPLCRIIFLTGFNEFDYAYNALKSSNVKFLLKSESDETILQTLRDIMEELDSLNNGIDKGIIGPGKTIELFIQILLDSIVYGKKYDTNNFSEIKRHIERENCIFYISVIRYFNHGFSDVENVFRNNFVKFINSRFKFNVAFNYNATGFLVIWTQKDDREFEHVNHIKAVLNKCKSEIEKSKNLKLTIALHKHNIAFDNLTNELISLNKNTLAQKNSEVIYSSSINRGQSEEHELLAHKVNDFIYSNLECSLNLPMIADYIGINASYLSRIYKSTTGMNISDYISNLKIEKSKKLLIDSNTSINDIAKRIGFETASSFITFFKQHTGKTPKNYREMT